MKVTFNKSDNRFHLYHSEGGENLIKRLARLDLFFLCGFSALQAFEFMNPFFGYWHSLSNILIIIFSGTGARALHHYSTRTVHNIWLLPDGKHIEVEFFSAFLNPKTEKMKILNFGYMEPSRFLNTDKVSYKSGQVDIYINMSR